MNSAITPILSLSFASGIWTIAVLILAIFTVGAFIVIVRCYRKVTQGKALVRNGVGGTRVSFSGMVVFPIIHQCEVMDTSVHRIEIDRREKMGLICKDNLRADIKVAFFVRVNTVPADVLRVAQSIGCERASNSAAISDLFEAKFSEALKTAGREFDFVDLYNSRQRFRDEILKIIGKDLNGYVLEDCAIDYLEQTKIENLDPDNILDSEGIKKITNLTAEQAKLSNKITREKQQAIKKQDVDSAEAILEMERQLAQAQQKQLREIASITAREQAEAKKIEQEQRRFSEQARIEAEEQIAIAEENKQRQVIVATRIKERTDKVESQKVLQEDALAANERERIVALAAIQKTKSVEIERKNIQSVIQERVALEKTVKTEEQNIQDIEQLRTADRAKKVAITQAEQQAEQNLVKEIKAAEAGKRRLELEAQATAIVEVTEAEGAKKAAEIHSQQVVIEANAKAEAAARDAQAKKLLAEATTAEAAAGGLGDAEVITAKAEAMRKQGEMEAGVLRLKLSAEAGGITQKAEAMQKLHEAGRQHEEFKLQLAKEQAVEIAAIKAHQDIASSQAAVVGKSLEHAHIDIVGGETQFFNRIVGAISGGKALEAFVQKSPTAAQIKHALLGNAGDGDLAANLNALIQRLGVTSESVKNLTVAAALGMLMSKASGNDATLLQSLKEQAQQLGLLDQPVSRVVPA
jgi:flotillin